MFTLKAQAPELGAQNPSETKRVLLTQFSDPDAGETDQGELSGFQSRQICEPPLVRDPATIKEEKRS